MLGCPISTKYGGMGYDFLTYCLALERIGEEGVLLGHSYQLIFQLVN
ncbi:MAG: acyl-CoA dehydrogenase family protein [Nitrososphaeraceae archaeon]